MGGDMPTVEQLTTALGDDANLSGIVSTEGGGYVTLLSQQEQSAYDRAVKMGNGVAARHYAIINASRVKRLLDKGIKGLNDGEIEKLGLKEPKPIVPVVDPVIVPEPEGGGNGGSGSDDPPPPPPGYAPSGVSEATQTIQDSIEAAALADTIDADAGSTETTSGSLTPPGELV